jgi:hypothetical protein
LSTTDKPLRSRCAERRIVLAGKKSLSTQVGNVPKVGRSAPVIKFVYRYWGALA